MNIFVFCFTSTGDLTNVFKKHLETYGGLDICINNAGIVNPTPFHMDQSNGTRSWKHTINVNLVAVIDCTRLAVCFKMIISVLSFYMQCTKEKKKKNKFATFSC